MFAFSPDPDVGPFAAWSWHRRCEEVRYDDASLHDAVAKLGEAGFTAIDLPISGAADAETNDAALRLIGFCRAAGLAVWLRPEEPWRGRLGGLTFEVFNLGSSEAAIWSAPHPPGGLLALDVVPLVAEGGAPRWAGLRSLDIFDDSRHAQIVTSLAAGGAGARVWAWAESQSSETDRIHGDWQPTAEALLAAAANAGTRDVVRGVHLAQLVPIGGQIAPSFPWVADLQGHFEALHGYAFPNHLTWLVGPTGDSAVRLRRHYWEALSHGFFELYRRPAELFCKDHALALRGSIATRNEGPALLSTWEKGGATRTPISPRLAGLAVRRAQFAAVLAGQRPPLATPVLAIDTNATSSARDWAETPASCAPRYHRLLADGASALETALAAPFDLGSPTVLRQPFAPHLGAFNAELANLTAAFGGQPSARVGLLWPERSMQAHYHPRGHRNVRWVEEDLCATVSLLDELHFDFVFCDEAHIDAAHIEKEGGECALACGAVAHRLSLIVLPSVTALSRATWNKLEQFVTAGGKLVCLGLLPRWSEIGRDPEFEEHVGKATMLIVADLYNAYASLSATTNAVDASAVGAKTAKHTESADDDDFDEIVSVIGYPVVRSQPSGGRVGCYQPRLNDDREDARLRVNQLLTESSAPDMETQAEGVRLTRRHAAGGDMVMATNLADRAQRVNLRLRTAGPAFPYLCDPRSGEVTPWYEWMELNGFDGEGVALTLEMGAGESALVYLAAGANFAHVARTNFVIEGFEGGSMRGHATAGGVPGASVWNEAGQSMSRWFGPAVTVPPPIGLVDEWQVLLGGHNLLALDLLRDNDGDLNITFELKDAVGPLWLRLPRCAGAVSLNGATVLALAAPLPEALIQGVPALLAAAAHWFELRCEPGEQELRVTRLQGRASSRRRKRIKGLIVGDFLLDEDGAIATARPLHFEIGSWHEQGLRDYCGEVVYKKNIDVPSGFAACRVYLELHDMRDTVAAELEGVSLGARSAPPYRFDATSALAGVGAGEPCSVVLRIFNTASAIEGSERETPPAGLLGPARLVAYPMVEIGGPQ